MNLLQPILHYGIHFLLPLAVAFFLFRNQWKRAYVIMIATMLVDLDHLLSYPEVFVADRCSIGFHPLHSWIAIGIYVALLLPPKTRVVAAGLVIHMIADAQDCLWMI